MKNKYHGIIIPIITPITVHEEVDEQGFRAMLEHCIANHLTDGIFVTGTNGECMTLTQAQREKAIKIVIDQCKGKVPVICGAMDSSTRRVIDNIKRIEQLGGTASVVTPSFYSTFSSQDEIIRHFEQISANTSTDLIVYNTPKYIGGKISFKTVTELAKIDRVVAYKDSGNDFQEFLKCLDYFRGSSFSLFQGVSNLVVPSVLLGADGYIPSLAPLFPSLYISVYKAASDKDIDRATAYNTLLLDVQKMLGMARNGVAAVKYLLAQLGYTDKRVLQPNEPLSQFEEQNILAHYKSVTERVRAAGI